MNKFKEKCLEIDEKKVAWKVLKIIGMVILGIGVCILLGFVIMWLWNWLMPMIFGLTTITYWQAVGIFILGKIIFGGFGGGHSDNSDKKQKGTIRGEIKREIKKEFDKEFDKEYEKEAQEESKDNEDYDKIYEQWWEKEGEKRFEEYMKTDTD
jgi:hypothetical protein